MARSTPPISTGKWTLVVLAAGLGRRYGGPKQFDPVGPSGETLSDYALWDARLAGAAEAVFVIAPEVEPSWRAHHSYWPRSFAIAYVPQQAPRLPEGFEPPPGRTKPWGTVPAVLAARPVVNRPFAVVNADDFYGRPAFEAVGRFLSQTDRSTPVCAVVGYPLGEVLSPHGGVSRALLQYDTDRRLTGVEEVTDVGVRNGVLVGRRSDRIERIEADELVSMNCWAFTQAIFPVLEDQFQRFLAIDGGSETAECLLPEALGAAVAAGRAEVRVLPEGRAWLGLSHREDRAWVQAGIRERVGRGEYPARLY